MRTGLFCCETKHHCSRIVTKKISDFALNHLENVLLSSLLWKMNTPAVLNHCCVDLLNQQSALNKPFALLHRRL